MASYTNLLDLELWDLLKSGNRLAFDTIWYRYSPKLLNHAYNKTRDREDARDIVQETFITLWEKKETLQIKTTLKGFLYTSIRNKILNKLLHEAVRDKYLASLLQFINDGIYETDHKIREQQLKDQIELEILELPAKMREVFEMSRNLHLNHREIAEMLGISEKTVSRHISSAIAILKSKLRYYIMSVWTL